MLIRVITFSIRRIIVFAVLFFLTACFLLFSSPKTASSQNVNELQKRADDIKKQIEEIDASILAAENQRSEIEAAIEEKRVEVSEISRELGEIEGAREERIDSNLARMREMYKWGRTDQLSVLLELEDPSKFIETVHIVRRIMKSDERVLSELEGALVELQSRRKALDSSMQELRSLIRSLDVDKLQRDKGALNAELTDINARIRNAYTIGNDIIGISPRPSNTVLPRIPDPPDPANFRSTGVTFSGVSSWYGPGFDGRSTASGVRYNMRDFTCAHKTLPFGTWLRVTFNGRSVIVQVNDRGPFIAGRILDLSWASAQYIGLTGIGTVVCEILEPVSE